MKHFIARGCVLAVVAIIITLVVWLILQLLIEKQNTPSQNSVVSTEVDQNE